METQSTHHYTELFQDACEIPLVKGRDFTLQDTKGTQRVVMVSEAFVNRYWPHEEALGKRLYSDLPKEGLRWWAWRGTPRRSA